MHSNSHTPRRIDVSKIRVNEKSRSGSSLGLSDVASTSGSLNSPMSKAMAEVGPSLDPQRVTNAEFIAVVFGAVSPAASPAASPAVCSKTGDPTVGGWIGYDAREVDARCKATTNNYLSCASFHAAQNDELRIKESFAVAYHCLVLDDVGSKTAFDAMPDIDPSWVLETSPGNFQVGYRLRTPTADFETVKAAQKQFFDRGLGDKAAGGVVRWVRLPNGVNGKPKYRDKHGNPFRCRLVTWNPEVSYELNDLVSVVAPPAGTMPVALENPVLLPVHAAVSHFCIPDEVYQPAHPTNPVVVALKEGKLYKREASPGVHEICCPWHAEHTDPEDDRAYLFEPSPNFPMGGFKCHHSHGGKYRLGALLEHVGLTRTDFHNKPRIRIVEGELQALVDAAQTVLGETGEYFQAGGIIVRVAIDPSTGAASLQHQTDADLTLALAGAANWERCEQKAEGLRWRRCNPLPNCVRLLTQAQNYSFLPVINGIARQPVLLADGRLVSQAGYDPASRYYCAFDAAKFARLEPTEANARASMGRLTQLLREFHFAPPRDRATALAAIFTAVLRMSLGRAPGFHVAAPAPGSGKSLLSEVIAWFAGPGHPAKVSYPRTEEEATKVILAALLAGPAVIEFDDMTLDWRPFGAINRLLTSATMTDRILGVSKMATVNTDTLVLGSGNNTGPVGDLIRRVVVINLDTRSESPATLRYKGDPLGEMIAKREAHVADVLLIVEAWIAAGRPKADLSPIATYGGRWTDYCRQPLVWLGLDDPAEGLIEQLKDDPDRAALGHFLSAWHAQLREKVVTLRGLMEEAEGDLAEAIEDLSFEGSLLQRNSRFGQYLKRNAGRPVSGLKLEKAVSRERNAWRVVPVDPPTLLSGRAAAAPPLPPSPPESDLMKPDRLSFD